MNSREQVIEHFEHCLESMKPHEWWTLARKDFLNDAIGLLKEDESHINFLKHQKEKGHWIFGNTIGHSWMKCSQCCVSQSGQTSCWSYCPNCGASMDEEVEHDG